MSARGVLIGLLAVLGGAWVLSPAAAAGWHGTRHGGPRVQLAELLAAAQAQKESHDLVAARATLEQAYALQPTTAVLCELGILAAADGRRLDAQDALRRCQAPGGAIPPAATPPPESGELGIAGPHRALVLVDAHVVGVLPLLLPLLLAPGTHQVQLAGGTHRPSAEVLVLPGRAALLTFTGKAKVTLLPAVALLVDFSHSPSEAGSLLRHAAAQAVQAQHLGILGQWGGLAEKLELTGCPDAPCEQTLAQRHRLRYVVAARALAEPDGWQLWTQLFDAEVGDVASEQAADCERCTLDQAGARLAELLTKTLHLGQRRPTGILEVTSTPPGGEVLLSGLRLGQTPLRRAAFAGEHAIVVQRAGFAPYQNEVVVEPGRGAALDATLRESIAQVPAPAAPPVPPTPVPPSPQSEPALALAPPLPEPRATVTRPAASRAPRPRWRVGLGAALTSVGAVVLGFGIAGLAVDGRCTQSPIAAPNGELCPSGRVVNSSGVGAALIAAGVVTVGLGASMWSLPGARAAEVQATSPASIDPDAADGAF